MEKLIYFAVYLDDFVFKESRGKILKYKITSILIDKHGIIYHASNEEDKHNITIPQEWIGEIVFLNEEDVK